MVRKQAPGPDYITPIYFCQSNLCRGIFEITLPPYRAKLRLAALYHVYRAIWNRRVVCRIKACCSCTLLHINERALCGEKIHSGQIQKVPGPSQRTVRHQGSRVPALSPPPR